MTKKVEEKEEKVIPYDQMLLNDIKYHEEEIVKKGGEINEHIGMFNYARHAYEMYMKQLSKDIEAKIEE